MQEAFSPIFIPCRYDYISYDAQCYNNVRLPISPNLQEIYLSNIFYHSYSVGYVWADSLIQLSFFLPIETRDNIQFATCFQPNRLKTIDVSFGNVMPTPTFLRPVMETEILESMEISGLYQLETLNMNYAELQDVIKRNILKVSPIRSIKHLHLRATDVLLQNDLQLCSKMKNLTIIDLSQNNLEALPKNLCNIHECTL